MGEIDRMLEIAESAFTVFRGSNSVFGDETEAEPIVRDDLGIVPGEIGRMLDEIEAESAIELL